MIAAPPFVAGAVNVTEAAPLPGVAVPMVGVPGTVDGMTVFDAADAGPVPIAFVAVTLQVYVLPFVNDATTIGLEAPEAEPAMPPFDDVQLAW